MGKRGRSNMKSNNKKILLISTCKEKLHDLEFVKPIEDILKKNNLQFISKNYKKLIKKDLENCNKIIISGTSLIDNEFLEDLKKFEFLKEKNKPVLGICAGFQIIGSIFDGSLEPHQEIGFYFEKFKKPFLGLIGNQEVYHLHNTSVLFSKSFERFTHSKIIQAVKHNEKEIYGVLFHPEVRQKELILNFVKL